MRSGWPFSLYTPFPDRWEFEPSIDYQLLPGRKKACLRMFTNSIRTKNAVAIFVEGGYFTFLMSGLKNFRNFTVVSYSHSNCLCQSLRS